MEYSNRVPYVFMWKLRSLMSSARKRSAVPVLMFFLLTCAGNVYGLTRGVVLTWDAPVTTNVIAVYHVYYGTKSGSYTNSVTADDPSGLVIKDLQGDMTYYFAVSATDTAGNNSPLSTEASVTLLNPKPVKLETEVYTDDNGLPFAMTITGTNTTTTDWELDYSTDLVNWTYLTGDHGIDIYQVVYFSDADQMFFRLMDY